MFDILPNLACQLHGCWPGKDVTPGCLLCQFPMPPPPNATSDVKGHHTVGCITEEVH